MRVFGASAYAEMMRLPTRAIQRFAQIQGERQAAEQLSSLRLMAVADGMEQGREYKPGPNDPKPKKGDGHYSLQRYRDLEDALERQAEPWVAAERQRRRRLREQDAKWAKLREAMGVGGGIQA